MSFPIVITWLPEARESEGSIKLAVSSTFVIIHKLLQQIQ